MNPGRPAAKDYDVIIVGGGPAGLATGIALAGRDPDLRLLILDRRAGPIDKACGEGIMPTGLALLRKLGVITPENEATLPGHDFAGIRYRSARGRTVAADFSEGPGRGLRRLELSRLLEGRTRELGIEQRRSLYKSYSYSKTGRRVEVHIDTKDSIDKKNSIDANKTGEVLTTRLLIGADGLHSRVRRQTGLAGSPAKLRRWGARRHFRVKPWSRHVEVHWRRDMEAYVTPVGTEEVGVSFLWNADRVQANDPSPAKNKSDDIHAALLRHFPEIQQRLAGAHALSETRTAGPLQQKTGGIHKDGVLLLGDAAGYLDASTGEGLSLAFAEALAAGAEIAPLLAHSRANTNTTESENESENGYLTASELAGFAAAQHSITASYYRMTNLVLLLHRLPFLQEIAIGSLSLLPGLFQRLLSINMGARRFFSSH